MRYSTVPSSASGFSVSVRERSNIAVPASTGSGSMRMPFSDSSTAGVLSITSDTWKNGVPSTCRFGWSTSTSFSNGTS
ncbi:hypothetical protein COSO111634_31805 [Corallococcus soli]